MPIADDAGHRILALVVAEITKRLEEHPGDFKAADFEFVRKLLADNSITLASIRRGDFGETAKAVAEQFPFPSSEEGDGAPKFN
jgi:hypothetical protein